MGIMKNPMRWSKGMHNTTLNIVWKPLKNDKIYAHMALKRTLRELNTDITGTLLLFTGEELATMPD